jgi:hypothetical protein
MVSKELSEGVADIIPSHQLMVEVTGAQYPLSGLAGGYLMDGKPNAIFGSMDTVALSSSAV